MISIDAKITITIAGKKVELTVEEARELKDKLGSIFGEKEYVYPYYPTYPYFPNPRLTWSTDTEIASATTGDDVG